MLSYFKRFRKEGSFARDALITVSWNGGIIAIQVLLSPIVTRIYGPAEYGAFAVFNSIVMNLSLLGSFKYNEAIVLSDGETEKNNLIAIALFLNTTVTLLVGAAVAMFHSEISCFIGMSSNSWVLYLLPISFSLTCLIEVLITVNIRRKLFNRNGFASFLTHLLSRLSNIGYAFILSVHAVGLVIGDVIGKIFCLLTLSIRSKPGNVSEREKAYFSTISVAGIRNVGRKFRSFPLYFFPSHILASVSGHMPIYFFQWLYGAQMVGAYALASSMLEMVNRLIPYSLAPVLLKKASDLRNVSHEVLCDRVYKLFLVMLTLSTCIFSVVCMLGDVVFPLVFGDSWKTAGVFAGMIAIPATFNFVAVALSEVYNVLQRQRFLLANTVFNFVLKAVAVAIFVFLSTNEEGALMVFSALSSIGGLFLVLGVFVILKYRVWQVAGLLILSLLILFVSFAVGKYIILA